MKTFSILGMVLWMATLPLWGQEPATITLHQERLMHEMRETPSPSDGQSISDRFVSLQWPMPARFNDRGSGLDGLADQEHFPDKSQLSYRVRYGRTPNLDSVPTLTTNRPFLNLPPTLEGGDWYWQYGYPQAEGIAWSEVLRFRVEEGEERFLPPTFEQVAERLEALKGSHPRVLLDGAQWSEIIRRSEGTPERKLFLTQAEKILLTPMRSVEDIAADRAANLQNEMQRKAMLTRESRRIIDAEEANTDILLRAWLLTRDERFADEALRRVRTMAHWGDSKQVVGDFNDATLLSLCSQAYDALYERLDEATREELLAHIRTMGEKMYRHYLNHLENHLADNHVWQMTLRILTMAAFSTYGELEEAATWADYCYNVWLARLPGLNRDGAWHNGDSYFHVNIRTLIEVPYLFGRLTGFDFFSDPWYRGNIRYVVYQQPPFSKSGGNGSSHQKILKPSGPRVSYAEALARLTGDPVAAAYVRAIQAQEPQILMKGCTGKSGGLAWWRLQCDLPMPEPTLTLGDLPFGQIFPESGLASFSTALDDTRHSAMLSFRSSPYGSTSHAVANQNAFNTFYGGQSLFYSSGHHVAFVDRHAVFCHRASRAHNTLLPDGLNQRIGVEGYGWIPRHYQGEQLAYVVGDASNAYGEVISPLWLFRARAAEIAFNPESGWDQCAVKRFRRHVITLGQSGYTILYDELEAEEPIAWHYLLHAVCNPIDFRPIKGEGLHIRTTNDFGASEAYLYGASPLEADTSTDFFSPAESWLRLDAQGNPEKYPDHWHFRAVGERATRYRFLTILYTHGHESGSPTPKEVRPGVWKVGGWLIEANCTPEGEASISVVGTSKQNRGIELHYSADEATRIIEAGEEHTLTDQLPTLEI